MYIFLQFFAITTFALQSEIHAFLFVPRQNIHYCFGNINSQTLPKDRTPINFCSTTTSLLRNYESLNQQSSYEKSSSTPPLQGIRKVSSIQKYARLPVWPAWNGAILFLLSQFLPITIISKLEDTFGGRVCPNFFESSATSPFIMLVHHKHSFTSFDPLRFFQSQVILPEGFPSHPHRGFITLTYCLEGGMVHRDSMGTKQYYGAEKRHEGNVAQWLVAGGGMLHEEMWDINHEEDGSCSKQELYQLWINLPSQWKMTSPSISLLNTNFMNIGNNHDQKEMNGGESGDLTSTLSIPIVKANGVETIVLAGEYCSADNELNNDITTDSSSSEQLHTSNVDTKSPMSILHVKMKPNKKWSINLPISYETGILYMRKGSVYLPSEDSTKEEIETHHTATLTPYGTTLTLESHDHDGADLLLLLGKPLYEPVEARGSMVMNSPGEIDLAYNDYSRGKMGLPWDHKFNDDEWSRHVRDFPSLYNK